MRKSIGVVIIGRNEGDRLVACLASLDASACKVVYVDSGSTDQSIAHAQASGAAVITLSTDLPFTAARARNAGIAALAELGPPDFVQFIDGDCILDKSWLEKATTFLQGAPKVGVVCGRRRERYPEASMYNRMCDAEWNTPIGNADACGGDALMRWDTLQAVEGFDGRLIAGEEPEMCLRMRRKGWQIWRLNAEMTLHDVAMTRFSQFWKRSQRAGFAAAQGADTYGAGPERYRVASVRRAIFWGGLLPLAIIISLIALGSIGGLLALAYPLQVLRLARREGGSREAWERGYLLNVGKFAEARGVLEYYWRKWRGRDAELIEYK